VKKTNQKSHASHVNRREFIAISSVVIAGAAVNARAAQLPASVSPLLSIGYFPGLPKDFSNYAQARQLDVMPAASLPTGDPSFLQTSALVRVEGFRRAKSLEAVDADYALVVRYRLSYENGATTPFVAWTRHSEGKVSSSSSPSSFIVPVDADTPLQFELLRSAVLPRRRRGVSIPVQSSGVPADTLIRNANDAESRFALALSGDEKTPKLASGTYFIALRSAADQKEPEWANIRLADTARGQMLDSAYLYERNVMGDRVVNFDYLVITIAHGAAAQ
jgi:hypothetical protein